MLLPFLTACSFTGSAIFNPAGPVTLASGSLMIRAALIMLIVVLPVFLLTAVFAVRYRASNRRTDFKEDWSSSLIDAVIWAVPAALIVVLAVQVWVWTHRLDPYRRLDGTGMPPLEIEVIAQDWKWLFLYPAEDIASVNELVLPVGRPIRLRITSDTVMNSFSVPALGGQIYAMAGMQTQLNLLADRPGRFIGRNMQYSGRGFADQYFSVLTVMAGDFDAWIAKARSAPEALDARGYALLAAPSIRHPAMQFRGFDEGLFDAVIARYGAHDHAAMK